MNKEKDNKITTLFLDIGGVLLTNGWDHHSRKRAVQTFHLDEEQMNARHSLLFDTFEIGKISLENYIENVVFYEPRQFSLGEFKQFMFAQSQAYEDMLKFIHEIKTNYHLKVIAVTNEGKELMLYRKDHFHLQKCIDFFVCSSFVHLRKPDIEIYRLALDLSQAKPQEVLYIDDRPLLTQIGESLGLQTITHQSYAQTKKLFTSFLQRS